MHPSPRVVALGSQNQAAQTGQTHPRLPVITFITVYACNALHLATRRTVRAYVPFTSAIMDTRSAGQVTAGVLGARTSKSPIPPTDDEVAHDVADFRGFVAAASIRAVGASQTEVLTAADASRKLGNCLPESETALPSGAGRLDPAIAPTAPAAMLRSNVSVVGAPLPMTDTDAGELPLSTAIAPQPDAVLAVRLTSAKCSHMLTLLRGRSHDNRPAYLHVLSADDDITSVERNDDMHGS